MIDSTYHSTIYLSKGCDIPISSNPTGLSWRNEYQFFVDYKWEYTCRDRCTTNVRVFKYGSYGRNDMPKFISCSHLFASFWSHVFAKLFSVDINYVLAKQEKATNTI